MFGGIIELKINKASLRSVKSRIISDRSVSKKDFIGRHSQQTQYQK